MKLFSKAVKNQGPYAVAPLAPPQGRPYWNLNWMQECRFHAFAFENAIGYNYFIILANFLIWFMCNFYNNSFIKKKKKTSLARRIKGLGFARLKERFYVVQVVLIFALGFRVEVVIILVCNACLLSSRNISFHYEGVSYITQVAIILAWKYYLVWRLLFVVVQHLFALRRFSLCRTCCDNFGVKILPCTTTNPVVAQHLFAIRRCSLRRAGCDHFGVKILPCATTVICCRATHLYATKVFLTLRMLR